MNARHLDSLAARGNAHAAWVVGWWQGKLVGFVLGLGAAVLAGWLK